MEMPPTAELRDISSRLASLAITLLRSRAVGNQTPRD